MFFILSKTLIILIDPINWIVILLAVAVFSKKSGLRKKSLLCGLSVFLFFTNPLIGNWVLQLWEYPATPKNELPRIKTAVILGGMTERHQKIRDQMHFSESVERITEPLSMYQQGSLQKLIISGGSGALTGSDILESTKLKEFTLTIGVPSKDLLIDTLSRNTHENAVETKSLLIQHHLANHPILLVTSAFHMRRSILCFQKQGIETIPFAVDFRATEFNWNLSWILPSPKYLNLWRQLIKEWIGIVAYKITGYI